PVHASDGGSARAARPHARAQHGDALQPLAAGSCRTASAIAGSDAGNEFVNLETDMSVPVPANPTIDIYRSGTAPPAAPAIAGVPCHLKADWCGGQEHGDKDRPAGNSYTHLALLDPGLDSLEHWLAAQMAGT